MTTSDTNERAEQRNFLFSRVKEGISHEEAMREFQDRRPFSLPRNAGRGLDNFEDFKRCGFIIGSPEDDLFVESEMPPGWSLNRYNSMNFGFLDEKGRNRGSYFHKAESYDQIAHASLKKCVSVFVDRKEHLGDGREVLTIHFNDNAEKGFNFNVGEFTVASTALYDRGSRRTGDKEYEYIGHDYIEAHKDVYERVTAFKEELQSQATSLLKKVFPHCADPGAYWDDDISNDVQKLQERLQKLADKTAKKRTGFFSRERVIDTLVVPATESLPA